MIRTLFKKLALTLLLSLTVLAVPATALAADPLSGSTSAVCTGVSGTLGGDCDNGGGKELTKITKLVVNVLSVIAGVAAVVMIIVGGLKYITSAGDAQSVASAKKTLIYAVVGLIIVSVAQILVRYVLFNAQK